MEKLLKEKHTLMVSSKDKQGEANISCAAYVYCNKKIYIYISEIANHYQNLLDNPKISAMIIEDEQNAKTVFDRERISLNCVARRLEESNEVLQTIYEKFDESHGAKMMKILKTMDFDIFELEILGGRYIEGFSRVQDITLENGEFKLKKADYKQH
ncbi:pyridoxamine 5'-phosphate oxidase family protein, partial [Romboutsia sp.]|uniref:pyridoxamine 5'-phosphate oxidase family protein n=1 Tax=Romboutsia sp. TaxID=1965302 RepID=UPI003F30390F